MSAEHSAPKAGEPQERLSLEQWITGIVMGLIALITLANVLVRYFTDRSFAATEEISVALLMALAFVGSATAFAHDRHIRVTFFVERLGGRPRQVFELGARLLTVGLFAFLVWYGGSMTWDQYRFEETSPALGVPQWWYTIWLPLLSAAIVLRVGVPLLRRGRR